MRIPFELQEQRKSAALESNAGEVCIVFYNAFQLRGADSLFNGFQRRKTVFLQHLPAEMCLRSGCLRGRLVITAGLQTGMGLKPGGQGVSHSCDQEGRRSLCDDSGIYQHNIGAAIQKQVLFKLSRRLIDND